ncbi:hypothetical protein V1517DRAFT_332691 [Lipomyces orientalis]|uniref:Uncharacterized protein n=1 Tax=Lipomyces orientalis TaxID=1233043 RepID=A0ACC3TDY2_9ASCO
MKSVMAFSPSSSRHHSVPFTLRNCQQCPKGTTYIVHSSSSPTTPNNGCKTISELAVRKQRQKIDVETGDSKSQTISYGCEFADVKPSIDANSENALQPYNPMNAQGPVQDFSAPVSLPPIMEYQLSTPYQGCYVPMPPLPQPPPPSSRVSSFDASRYGQRKPVDPHSPFLSQRRVSSDYMGNARRRREGPDIDENLQEVMAQVKVYLTIIKLGVCVTAWMFNALLGVAVFIFIFGSGLIELLPRSRLLMLASGLNTDGVSYRRASSSATNTSRPRKPSEMMQPLSLPMHYVASRHCS